jgi:hypothetical protein
VWGTKEEGWGGDRDPSEIESGFVSLKALEEARAHCRKTCFPRERGLDLLGLEQPRTLPGG